MELPYSEITLRVALLGINPKNFTDEKGEELSKELEGAMPKNQAELTQKAAEFYGITLDTLINSANYTKLVNDFRLHLLTVVVQKSVEKLKITEKQAWALIAYTLGLLN